MNPRNVNIADLEIDNKYSFLILNFPVSIKQKTSGVDELFTRLAAIRKQTTILKESYDYQVWFQDDGFNFVQYVFMCFYL